MIGDPRFELAVPSGDLLIPLTQLAEQPRVIHRDDRLRGEVLKQRDLPFGVRTLFFAIDRDEAEQPVVFTERDSDVATIAILFGGVVDGQERLILEQTLDM